MKKNSKNEEAQKLMDAMQQQEQVMQALFQRDAQTRRLLWELVRQMGGQAVIPNRPTPALWNLSFQMAKDEQMIAIVATEMAEPTKEQLDRLANELRGTQRILAEAMETTDLREHPPQIIEHILSKEHVIFSGNVWLDAEIAREIQKQSGDAPNKN